MTWNVVTILWHTAVCDMALVAIILHVGLNNRKEYKAEGNCMSDLLCAKGRRTREWMG